MAHGAAPDPALQAGVAQIQIHGGPSSQYADDVESQWDDITYPTLGALQKARDPSRRQHILRWPRLHEDGLWIGYNVAGNQIQTHNIETEGFCHGSGQSMFKTWESTPELFPHEMGHAMNLVHFVAENFEWKHHHVSSQDCLMSYDYTKGQITRANAVAPVGPTGGGTTRELGWPDALGGGAFGIKFRKLQNIPLARDAPCAKCALKVRGWNDEVLPFAWNHPDLF